MSDPIEPIVTDAPVVAAAPNDSAVVDAGGAVAAEPAPSVEPVASVQAEGVEQPKAETSEPELTLLEKFDAEKAETEKPAEKAEDKTADEKPADGEKKPEEPKPDDAPKEAAPLEPVDYFEKLTIPETIVMDDEMKGKVASAFDAFRADPAAGAQGLIDLHNETMQTYADHVSKEQHRVWNETRKGWVTEAMADPVIGGAGFQTAMGKIAEMRDMFVPEADKPAFEQFLRVTGAGDHPAFLRMMHTAARHFGAPAMPPPGAKPAPNNGKPPKRGAAALYDHPSSQR